eukprot:scaffold27941_cov84-Isochrysis_galbana.AAC.1
MHQLIVHRAVARIGAEDPVKPHRPVDASRAERPRKRRPDGVVRLRPGSGLTGAALGGRDRPHAHHHAHALIHAGVLGPAPTEGLLRPMASGGGPNGRHPHTDPRPPPAGLLRRPTD